MKGLLYTVDGQLEDDCIYIIEDSMIDLGLVVSIERNLKRYFEMIADYIDWHQMKMKEVPQREEENQDFEPDFSDAPHPVKKKSLWRRCIDWIKHVLHIGKKKDDIEENDAENNIETPVEDHSQENIESDTDINNDDNLDIEMEPEEVIEQTHEETYYQKNYFLKFGFDSLKESIDLQGVYDYLSEYGFDHNSLTSVRQSANLEKDSENNYDPHKFGVHLCDFCGRELAGQYDVLKDGRERCNRCSQSALTSDEEFRNLYKSVLRNMEIYYGIKINVAIKVRMTDAKKIAKHCNIEFVATPGYDGRVLGFAQKDKTGYTIYLENGSPRLAAIATLAHELTHIWQYLNWDQKEIAKKYGKQNVLEVYEGMAKWAEIQYLMLMNEVAYGKREEIATRQRNDEYGHGFKIYAEKYPISYETQVKHSPFMEKMPL
jgi:hypothetical protein